MTIPCTTASARTQPQPQYAPRSFHHPCANPDRRLYEISTRSFAFFRLDSDGYGSRFCAAFVRCWRNIPITVAHVCDAEPLFLDAASSSRRRNRIRRRISQSVYTAYTSMALPSSAFIRTPVLLPLLARKSASGRFWLPCATVQHCVR